MITKLIILMLIWGNGIPMQLNIDPMELYNVSVRVVMIQLRFDVTIHQCSCIVQYYCLNNELVMEKHSFYNNENCYGIIEL